MTSVAVAQGALNLAGVRLLCTIGSCAGLIVFLLGLWLNRKARSSSQEPHSKLTDACPRSQEPPGQPPLAAQQIIRLTTNPGATRSSEMSQQQRIAAALDRAGIATSASWSNPAPLSEPATEQEPPAASSTPSPAIAPEQAPIQTHSSSLIRKMFLLGGSMLALISLIVFLTIR
jgi:predicted component of type VI protein secretion system